MIEFILNNKDVSTDLPAGMTVLDFVRYRQNLKGTKIGCREGDCGACTILVGELKDEKVRYRSMTSCLMPLANAAGKHIVTIEGINPEDGSLTPVQQALIDESGTQCGFCTVGFVMSLTGFCIDGTDKTPEMAVSAIDGNICRCTGYKSIERAARIVCQQAEPPAVAGGLTSPADTQFVPEYFADIPKRLRRCCDSAGTFNPLPRAVLPVSGGTDVYVQRPDTMAETTANHLFYNEEMRGIRDLADYVEIGASATVTDLLESSLMHSIFPKLYEHLKLVSSTPIRNMATLAGNFVNASPIGDMTVWFLALDASILLSSPPYEGGVAEGRGGSLGGNSNLDVTGAGLTDGSNNTAENHPPAEAVPLLRKEGSPFTREIPLSDLYLGYKKLAKSEDEIITAIRFKKPLGDFRFSFEKVCKRTYLDIATVNTAISLKLSDSGPPVPEILRSKVEDQRPKIEFAHLAAGGVAPIPLYLRNTSEYLTGKEVTEETIANAIVIMQNELSPISDVRGTEAYKRLLLKQLFKAHFVELLGKN